MSKIDVKITPKNAPGSEGFEAELEGDMGGGTSYTAGAGIAISEQNEISNTHLAEPTQDGTYLFKVTGGVKSWEPYVQPVIPDVPVANVTVNMSLFTTDGEDHDLTEEQIAELAKITANVIKVNGYIVEKYLSHDNGGADIVFGCVEFDPDPDGGSSREMMVATQIHIDYYIETGKYNATYIDI